jgi:hypothetical protein
MASVSVRIKKNNKIYDENDKLLPEIILDLAQDQNEIKWLVEGEPGDTVFVVYQRKKPAGKKKFERFPLKRTPKQIAGDLAGVDALVFRRNEKLMTKELTTGKVQTNPGKGKTESWKFSIVRVRASGKVTFIDPMIRVRGTP